MRRRLQNKIAESSVALPIVSVGTTLLWWLPQGRYSTPYLLGWLACALTAYVLIETVAVNRLLRIRSRIISCLFLLLMAVSGFLHPIQDGTLITLCLAIAFYCLFRTYEKPHPQVDTFHVYLFLSLGSLLWPPLLLLTVVFWWNQIIYLRSLNLKSLVASFIGLLLPYAFWATGAFALKMMPPFIEHCSAIIQPVRQPILQAINGETFLSENYRYWYAVYSADHANFFLHLRLWALARASQLSSFGLVLLLGLTGFIHYVRKSYDDKIQVRMCHYSMMSLQVLTILWLLFQPRHFHSLFPILLLTTVPAAGHFVALTRTWLTNVWTIFLALLFVAVGLCNLLPFPA